MMPIRNVLAPRTRPSVSAMRDGRTARCIPCLAKANAATAIGLRESLSGASRTRHAAGISAFTLIENRPKGNRVGVACRSRRGTPSASRQRKSAVVRHKSAVESVRRGGPCGRPYPPTDTPAGAFRRGGEPPHPKRRQSLALQKARATSVSWWWSLQKVQRAATRAAPTAHRRRVVPRPIQLLTEKPRSCNIASCCKQTRTMIRIRIQRGNPAGNSPGNSLGQLLERRISRKKGNRRKGASIRKSERESAGGVVLWVVRAGSSSSRGAARRSQCPAHREKSSCSVAGLH